MKRGPREFRIVCLVALGDGFCRAVWAGVVRWRNQTPGINMRSARTDWDMYHLTRWQPDGVITISPVSVDDRITEIKRGIPHVRISSVTLWDKPSANADFGICVDDDDIGRTAAEYFLDRGFKNFAFLCLWDHPYGARREAPYRRRLAEAGASCISYLATEVVAPTFKKATAWIRSLPPRTALVLADDSHTIWMHDLIEDAGRRVPDDIAILSVGNDEQYCEATHPPTSSVILPAVNMGETAARTLHELLRGRRPRQKRIDAKPLGICVRQSSDIFATEDHRLRQSLEFIRTNADRALSPREVARASGWNRRAMERSFRIALDRSPLEEIHKVRVVRAQELLRSGLTVSDTIQRLNFRTFSHFSHVFRSVCGESPRQYMGHL